VVGIDTMAVMAGTKKADAAHQLRVESRFVGSLLFSMK
jgi:hypothetical protein